MKEKHKRTKADANGRPSINETRNDDRVLVGNGKLNSWSSSSNHIFGSPFPINKKQGEQSSSELKTTQPICHDSIDLKDQRGPSAMFGFLDDVYELERAFLRERKTNAFCQSSEELWLEERPTLQKEREDALARTESTPQNPLRTTSTSVSKTHLHY